MEPEEARLLACLAANLNAHFADLVTAYQHRLYVFVLRQTGSVQDAEDIVQETFLQAYFALGNYPGWRVRTLRLQAWLYRIALNLFYSRMRSAKPLLVSLGSEEGRLASFTAEVSQEEQPESLFESQEARQELEACVARLPVHYREAINLYYFEGLTYQEISDLLEQPMGTIKSYLHRGVRLLRKLAAETSEKGVR
jgi:RNA polymerase sigma-70 factor, ECF subfamily